MRGKLGMTYMVRDGILYKRMVQKRYFELRSTRKLTSLDKKKKQARIVHSYKYCGE